MEKEPYEYVSQKDIGGVCMTVQELFRKANKQMVFNAYVLIEPLFDDLNKDSLAVKAGNDRIGEDKTKHNRRVFRR